jgi:hypothetical protein
MIPFPFWLMFLLHAAKDLPAADKLLDFLNGLINKSLSANVNHGAAPQKNS